MSKTDLSIKTKLVKMYRLDGALDGLEAAGSEPTTPADAFEGRNGYNPDFLEGWSIPFPKATGTRKADMRSLRRGGSGVELTYQNFSAVLSKSRRMPMATAANIDGSASRRLPRAKVWKFDGRLDKGDQWGDSLYESNILDRGHMVRREDPVWGTLDEARLANVDTFHFTNSCPQVGGVNQQVWLGLEDYILQNARVDKMCVSVFTGPFFSDKDLQYRDGPVPLAFWKVVAIVTEEGRPSATAYKVSQSRELEDLELVYGGYKTFQISIQQVIDDTQLDFKGLVEYDGFSQYELATGETLVERLETLDRIRI